MVRQISLVKPVSLNFCYQFKFDQGIPDSDADQFYTIWLSDDSVMKFSAPEMPSVIPANTPNAPPLSLPAWICSNHKVLYLHEGQYHRGFLNCTETNTWQFEIRSCDGQVKQTFTLPDLAQHYQWFVDTNSLIPGWPKTPRVIWGTAAHVSACNLMQPCPGTLAKALHPNNPDRDT
jgi:hypothetical protein